MYDILYIIRRASEDSVGFLFKGSRRYTRSFDPGLHGQQKDFCLGLSFDRTVRVKVTAAVSRAFKGSEGMPKSNQGHPTHLAVCCLLLGSERGGADVRAAPLWAPDNSASAASELSLLEGSWRLAAR